MASMTERCGRLFVAGKCRQPADCRKGRCENQTNDIVVIYYTQFMKEATRKTMFSSVRMDWATPMDFFKALDAEFHFTLDPCASPENAKCKKYYTEQTNGLLQS